MGMTMVMSSGPFDSAFQYYCEGTNRRYDIYEDIGQDAIIVAGYAGTVTITKQMFYSCQDPISMFESVLKYLEPKNSRKWTKCQDCGAECQQRWTGDRIVLFSNGGKEHSRVCPMKNQYNAMQNIANDPAYQQTMMQRAQNMANQMNAWNPPRMPTEKEKTKPTKKLPIAPPAGKRMIKLDEDDK